MCVEEVPLYSMRAKFMSNYDGVKETTLPISNMKKRTLYNAGVR